MSVLFRYILWYFILSCYINFVYTSSSCEQRQTCGECIRDPSVCVWCADNGPVQTRCQPRNSLPNDWCPSHLQDPKTNVTEIDNHNFSSDTGNVIQIKPQKYKILTRLGESVNFNFSFKVAENYPVDLYFLMDASNTMKDVKDQTAAQSENIYQAMKKFTNNVYLGMGSFVEKNVLPFTDHTTNSSYTYSFRHRLKLTNDSKEFQRTMLNAPFGYNRDSPEAGLDALAQVIVCNDTIGWRTESRKIVIFITNGLSHVAGDGRNGGIFEPYDGKCYTPNNTYTKEAEMDYPSLPMINKLAKQNGVIVVFFVHEQIDILYRELSSIISGSLTVNYATNKLEEKETFVNILKDVYETITKKIKLTVNIKSENRKNIQISFNPDCKNEEGSKCEINKGEEQLFVSTLKVIDSKGVDKFSFNVAIEGISEKLTVDVEIIKKCDCEKTKEKSSEYCHNEPRQCGICKCGHTRYGDRCKCEKNVNNPHNDKSTCIADGSTDPCSGRGFCDCGVCQCRERFSGKYCQCNKDNCPRRSNSGLGEICSGKDNGNCECGTCLCKSGWTGVACDCTTSVKNCISLNEKVCNNRGRCECGSCKCELAEWDKRYRNHLCEALPCPQCHNAQCDYLNKIAYCYRKPGGCIDTSNDIKIETVKILTNEYLNDTEWKLCPDLKIDVGCYTRYVYKYNDNDDNYEIFLLLQEDKDCLENYLVYGGVLLVTLVLIGLFTLIAWKVLTEARDKMEYDKFVKDQKDGVSGPIPNPLYAPATTTFSNPVFRKQSIY